MGRRCLLGIPIQAVGPRPSSSYRICVVDTGGWGCRRPGASVHTTVAGCLSGPRSDLERDHHHPDILQMPLLKRSPVVLRRCYSTTPNSPKLVVGIRKEDPSRIWERRAPLTPDAVHHLVRSTGVDVLIQDCERRAFRTSDYLKAGAHVHNTLEPAHIVLGIKETPIDQVLTAP